MASGMKTPLNNLRAFIAAGQHLSFKKAAAQLCLTPPAVSHQIKQMEESLGFELFVRGNRQLKFTTVGEVYWRDCQHLVTQLDQLTHSLSSQNNQRVFKLSVMPPLANNLLFPNLADFQQAHPDIRIIIDSSTANMDVLAGDADLAIRFGEGDWPGLVAEKIQELYIRPIFPPAFAERYNLTLPADLKRVPLVHMSARPGAWQRWFSELGLGKPQPEQEFQLDDYPAAIEAAKTLGGALALFPVELPLLKSGQVIAPVPQFGPLDESVCAVYRPEDAENPSVRMLIDWIRGLFDQLSD